MLSTLALSSYDCVNKPDRNLSANANPHITTDH